MSNTLLGMPLVERETDSGGGEVVLGTFNDYIVPWGYGYLTQELIDDTCIDYPLDKKENSNEQ